MSDLPDITQLVAQARGGDHTAENALFQLVYDQLRNRAHALLHAESNATLSSGTLVHEAFAKLFRGTSEVVLQDRAHFFHVAARAMRQVVIERARRQTASMRGGHAVKVPIEEETLATGRSLSIEDVIAISDACDRLATAKPLWAQVLELRFFGGLTVIEIKEILGVSDTTVDTRLKGAKAFIQRELSRGVSRNASGA